MTIVLIIITSLLLIGIIIIYNKLVKNKNRMQEAWSIIDVFLKKRYDLVPNLVDTVKTYASHEKNTLEKVTYYRSEAMHSTEIQARTQSENGLGNALSALLIVAENYPELKANNNFLQLQHQLVDLENDLEKARRYYNGTVRENNIYQESFPSNIIARIFQFSKGEFFNTDIAEKAVPDITL